MGDPWSTELSDIAQVIDKGVSKIGVEGRILPETLFVTTSFDETAEKIRMAVALVDPAGGASA